VGRYLEHSRIFHFGAGQTDPADGEWFIGTADWMHRNLNDRVECTTPVRDPVARGRLLEIMQIMLADKTNAWDLERDGSYTRAIPGERDAAESAAAIGTFESLMRLSLRHAEARPESRSM
jgi:polyphosphate kinase